MKKRCMQCMKELNESQICECGCDNTTVENRGRALPVETMLNGKYMVGKVIGEGGFGITYVAWDTLINTRVAIKEYFPSKLASRSAMVVGSDEVIEGTKSLTLLSGEQERLQYKKGLDKFAEEASRLARFHQMPGVVSVKDFFYENNTAYMVMEYIEGETLKSYLEKKNGRTDVQEVLRMVEPVIKTLDEVHKQGVVHRDISPDNIMVTKDGQLKLIDFGAARFIDVNDEKSLTVILKHGYAPEEQYRTDGNQGAWTDVYALCAVIYRMLFGEVPPEVAQRMTEKEDTVKTQLYSRSDIPVKVKNALLKGMAVKEEKRYQSMTLLYSGLYGEKKNSWLSVGAVVAAAVVLLGCFALFGNKDKSVDEAESVAVEGESVAVAVVEEESTGETEENSYYEQYCQLYNEEYCHLNNSRYFLDLNGDGMQEMAIVLVNQDMKYNTMQLDIWSCNETEPIKIYEEKHIMERDLVLGESQGVNYYLCKEDGYYILKEEWELLSTEVDLYNGEKKCKGYTKIEFFELSASEIWTESNMDFEEARINRDKSVALHLSSCFYHQSYQINEFLTDNSQIDKEIEDLDKILERGTDNKIVLDYAVSEGENKDRGIFFISVAINNQNLEELDPNIDVWCMDVKDIIKVSEIPLDYTIWLETCETYQFGPNKQYMVTTDELGMLNEYKFGFEDRKPMQKEDTNAFVTSEREVIQLETITYLNRDLDFDTSCYTYTDVFYNDNQYIEYGCWITEDIKEYSNYVEILNEIEDELKATERIEMTYDSLLVDINEVCLEQILVAANGYYYLNYIVKGNIFGWENGIAWMHAVVYNDGGKLVLDRLLPGKKETQSDAGYPLYYGEDEVVVGTIKLQAELKELIEKKCEGYIQSVVYDDFDNDGYKEMFAYTIEERCEVGDFGCYLWYTNGTDVLRITLLEDGYYFEELSVVQLGNKKQFEIKRKGHTEALGYLTTKCSVESGKVSIVSYEVN